MSVESMDWQFPQQPYQPFPPAVITWPTITLPTWVDLSHLDDKDKRLIRISDISEICFSASINRLQIFRSTGASRWDYPSPVFEYVGGEKGLPPFVRKIAETLGIMPLMEGVKWAEEEPKEKASE